MRKSWKDEPMKKKKAPVPKSLNDERFDRLAEILKNSPPGTADRLIEEVKKEERKKRRPN